MAPKERTAPGGSNIDGQLVYRSNQMPKWKSRINRTFFPRINRPVCESGGLDDRWSRRLCEFKNQRSNCATIGDGAVANSTYGDHSVREFQRHRSAPRGLFSLASQACFPLLRIRARTASRYSMSGFSLATSSCVTSLPFCKSFIDPDSSASKRRRKLANSSSGCMSPLLFALRLV